MLLCIYKVADNEVEFEIVDYKICYFTKTGL